MKIIQLPFLKSNKLDELGKIKFYLKKKRTSS